MSLVKFNFVKILSVGDYFVQNNNIYYESKKNNEHYLIVVKVYFMNINKG